MLKTARLFFLVPALFVAAPVAAEAPTVPAIKYVTLDKMIRSFAAEARRLNDAR